MTAGSRGVTFAVYVTPRAGRSEVAGIRQDALWLRLAAPPVDGQANAALIAFLAEALGVPKRDVSIVSGQSSRTKRVRVLGLDEATLRDRLARG